MATKTAKRKIGQKLWVIADNGTISGLTLSKRDATEFRVGTERMFSVELTTRQLKQITSNLNNTR